MKQYYFGKKHSKPCFFVAILTLLLVISLNANSQTTIIDPVTVGGFQTGTTFATNGWTATAGATNQWIDNTAATAGFTGTRCAYISNAGTAHTYATGTSSVSHFYRNITIPAGENNIALTFKWINQGESGYDRIKVWVVPTTFTPVNGTAITSSGVAPTGNIQIGGDLVSQGTWTTANLLLPSGYAGTTVRLVFEWSNDSGGGTQPPGGIDDISLASSVATVSCTYTTTNSTYWISNVTTTGGVANINNTTTYSAGGYGDYYPTRTISQVAGGGISFGVTMSSSTHGINIYIDWNNDFDYADAGEKVYASGAMVASAAGSFSVSAAQPAGNYRMRVVSNYSNSNPLSCSSETYTEAEDYKFTVLAPLACSGNPSNPTVFIVSMTASNISWTAASPAPANGYQYYLSTSSTFPSAGTAATGSTAAGVTTASLTGLTSGTTYYAWVRSNCGGGLGQGAWVGTLTFTQPTCVVGNGTGTTTLGCPFSTAGGLGLSGADPAAINCSTAACVNLEVTYAPIKQTTSYAVASIAYAPPYQFNCMRNPVSVNTDDKWSPIIDLPFNFCFYGNTYNQCLIGSNGIITFDTVGNIPGGTCDWSFYAGGGTASNIPVAGHEALKENSIFGVFHDIDPKIAGGEVGWELITLNTGCRALVASWNNIAMYSASCNSQKYTGMIVLYENTNIIEVYIKEKNVCPTWNEGNAIVGMQNATGTVAAVAPSRNGLDPNWTVTNEAWRFTPAGANVPTSIKWYEGAGTAGPVVGNTATINVCPTTTKTYTAEITYTLCGGLTYSVTDPVIVNVDIDKTWTGTINTDWNTSVNWSPIGVPTSTQSVSIPNVANDPVIASGINALACSILVQNGGVLTVNSANNLTVTNAVSVVAGGTFNVKNTANLVQINNVTNSGDINMERIANLRLQDYCYWSSPVGSLLTGTFPVANVSPLTPAGFIYKWGTTTANPNGGQGNWVNTAENMIPAQGYIVRGPTGFNNASTTPLTANFVGTPNNGIFSPTIFRGIDYTTVGTQGILRTATDDNWNLIGNPYPSAIGVNEFLTLPANNTITGGIKIWSHGLLPTNTVDPFYQNFVFSYYPSDYISINLTGATSAPGDYKIGSGQGFMVLMNAGVAGSSTVTFNNSMRSATFANNQFYKNANKTNIVEQNRIWLDLVAPTGEVNRTLIGYVDGATNAEDRLYDMFTDNKPNMNFYSLIDGNPMIIQGKTIPFDVNDTIPMGVQIPVSGTYKIAIATLDGLFTGGAQIVYLEDKLLNVIHNLTATPYQFTENKGIINERFVLRYTKNTLSNNDFNYLNDIKIFTNNGINIISTKENIKDVIIYDVLGKTLLDRKNISKHEVILTELRPTTNVLIVKVTLENNKVVIKKVIY